MELQELVRLYPRVYHMAAGGSWPSIRRHGLLSTEALLDLFEVPPARRTHLLRKPRTESVTIEHREHGTAVVRDQKPLREQPLEKCLVDMTVEEWLQILNRQVFFWLQEARLERMLGAPPYREDVHDVLVVDTASLVEAHGDRAVLSRINSGATLFNPPERGRDTFKPIDDYPHPERRTARASASDVAELAIPGSVPDIERHVVRVERRQAGRGVLEVVSGF